MPQRRHHPAHGLQALGVDVAQHHALAQRQAGHHLAPGVHQQAVAEGAETSGEVSLLQEFGVEKIQGYAIAKPLPKQAALERCQEIETRYRKIAV